MNMIIGPVNARNTVEVPIAIGLGYLVYRKGKNVMALSIYAILLMYLFVFLGPYMPVKMPAVAGIPATGVWTIILLAYAFFASVLPVTTLSLTYLALYVRLMRAAMLETAFEAFELHRLEADIDPDNAASLALLRKFGFREEGRFRERWLLGEEWRDSIMMALLATDWRLSRTR